jgi:hypothetical protein
MMQIQRNSRNIIVIASDYVSLTGGMSVETSAHHRANYIISINSGSINFEKSC